MVTDARRSHFIHSTMNPKICDGIGSDTKITFLSGTMLCGEPISWFHIHNNPTLANLVISVKDIVADRYQHFNNNRSSGVRDVAVYPPVGRMQDHRGVIEAFGTALSLPWPSSDKAVHCHITKTSSTVEASCSGSKRSRITFETQQTDGDQPPRKRKA
jgi:hypothetical protein